ncbi:MAG: hypothetical protein Q8N20_00510, partial [Eubacteriales bacterium]|nr:hypothetical protein [Eubacteriales bacterium]
TEGNEDEIKMSGKKHPEGEHKQKSKDKTHGPFFNSHSDTDFVRPTILQARPFWQQPGLRLCLW